jgi:threonine dehydratase
VRAANERLEPYELATPLVRGHTLGAGVFLKCENLQRTGSFKLRGALNRILSLTAEQRERGVVTSSTGNHGLAVGTALRMTSGRGTVIVSSAASPYKIERLASVGLEVVTLDVDAMTAELTARALAEREGKVYISPYNDLDVVAGQGTVAVEIIEERPSVDVVYVAVGGGGLIGGMAAYLAAARPGVTVVGCWPERAAAMYESVRAGRIVDVPDQPTLSDGTAGNIEPGSVTFPLCCELIDEHVLVSEHEIARAMRDVAVGERLIVEGAAGVAVAGWRKLSDERPEIAERPSVLVLCGGNVSTKTLADVLGRS